MKRLLCLSFAIAMLPGCAGTRIRNGSNVKILDTQANFSHAIVKQGDLYVEMWDVDHSTATLAGGQAFALGVDSVGRGATQAALAYGSGGASKFAGGGAAAATLFNRPQTIAPTVYRAR